MFWLSFQHVKVFEEMRYNMNVIIKPVNALPYKVFIALEPKDSVTPCAVIERLRNSYANAKMNANL